MTLIVIAYYLAILNVTLDTDKYYHLNLLMIDSPRKNLGADASQEEFRDEEIFNSVIKTFIEFEQELGESMQLIVVNNGYPDFVPKDDIRVGYVEPKEKASLVVDAELNPCPKSGGGTGGFAQKATKKQRISSKSTF